MTDKTLSLGEAIQTALEYENNVRDLYLDASKQATEEVGQRLFKRLADEEQGHVDFLESRLDEWEKTGKVEEVELTTLMPTRQMLNEGMARLEHRISDHDWTLEIELLRKARAAEAETGSFYKRMVSELDEEGQRLFQPFLEIEDAHYDIVQAELDALQGGGFWFDFMEFNLEGA